MFYFRMYVRKSRYDLIWMSQYHTFPKKQHGKLLTIEGGPISEEPHMFEIVMYLSVFNCLCCVKEISADMLEEQVLGKRDLDLNEEEDIRMEDIRE